MSDLNELKKGDFVGVRIMRGLSFYYAFYGHKVESIENGMLVLEGSNAPITWSDCASSWKVQGRPGTEFLTFLGSVKDYDFLRYMKECGPEDQRQLLRDCGIKTDQKTLDAAFKRKHGFSIKLTKKQQAVITQEPNSILRQWQQNNDQLAVLLAEPIRRIVAEQERIIRTKEQGGYSFEYLC